jgi:hypothetical protein
MIGNPVAKAAAWCRAEPGDLYAATCIARRLARPESACYACGEDVQAAWVSIRSVPAGRWASPRRVAGTWALCA